MPQPASSNGINANDRSELFCTPEPEETRVWEDVVIGEETDSTGNQSTQKQSKLAVGVKQVSQRLSVADID
jgi:hypothetical protein